MSDDNEMPEHDGRILPIEPGELDAIYKSTRPIQIVRTMSYDWPQLSFRCTVMFLAPPEGGWTFKTEAIGMN